MAVYVRRLTIVVILFTIISTALTEKDNTVQIDGNFHAGIAAVQPKCSENTALPANITVLAEFDITVYIHCKDHYSEKIKQDSDLVHYTAMVFYTGNTSEQCVFSTNSNSKFYQVALEIYYLKDGVMQYKDAFLVTCTYSNYQQTLSSSNPIGQPLVAAYQTYKHIHRVHSHEYENTSSSFTVEVLDIRNKIVTDSIPLGEKIKLRISMIAGRDIDKGFHVFNCEAVGSPGIEPFAFIREGCGEGVIIGRTAGFVTNGYVAESPYFNAFNLYGSKTVNYVCHFYICHESCDGPSCIHSTLARRKRRAPSQMGQLRLFNQKVERIEGFTSNDIQHTIK